MNLQDTIDHYENAYVCAIRFYSYRSRIHFQPRIAFNVLGWIGLDTSLLAHELISPSGQVCSLQALTLGKQAWKNVKYWALRKRNYYEPRRFKSYFSVTIPDAPALWYQDPLVPYRRRDGPEQEPPRTGVNRYYSGSVRDSLEMVKE